MFAAVGLWLAYTSSGLNTAATAEDANLSPVPQVDNLINPAPPVDEMAQKAKAFDTMVAQANKEYADEQNRLAEQAAAALENQRFAASYAPQGTCNVWMVQAGINDMANAYQLILRESGCNPNAVNASSGACGIGQQLPCGKWPHAWNDPVGGMIDMQNYVFSRYGSWANAWWHEVSYGWY